MVRSEIISELSKKIHQKLKKTDLEKILDIFFDKIIDGIKNNKNTELRDFGRFSVKKIKERKNARNPRTGEIIYTIEKKSVAFRMSTELKSKI